MTKRSTIQLILAGLTVVILAGLGVGVAVYANRDMAAQQTSRSPPNDDDQEAIMAAKAALSTRMVAAQSLSFGAVTTHWAGGVPSVCGEVDIQEEQDAFGGSERFVYSQGALFIEEIDGGDTLDQKWNELCQ